jgi:hypothetical protein
MVVKLYTLTAVHVQCTSLQSHVCTAKMKVMEFQGSDHIRAKVLTDNKVNEQIKVFNYLG